MNLLVPFGLTELTTILIALLHLSHIYTFDMEAQTLAEAGASQPPLAAVVESDNNEGSSSPKRRRKTVCSSLRVYQRR